MPRPLLIAAVCAAAASCVPLDQPQPIQATLAQLAHRDQAALTYLPGSAQLVLRYNPFSGGCAVLPALTRAKVNGDPLRTVSLGDGSADGERGPSADACTRPTWAVDARHPDEAVTAFEVTDGESVVRAELLQVAAPRAMALQSPDGGVRSGDLVVLSWSPDTDLPFFRPGNSRTLQAWYLGPDGGQPQLWTIEGSVDGGLHVRAGSGAPGPGRLTISGELGLGVRRCEPAGLRCEGVDHYGAARWPIAVPVERLDR